MGDGAWRVSDVELVGRSKVAKLGRFPSDHWGLQIEFTDPTTAKLLSASFGVAEPPVVNKKRRMKATGGA